MVLVDFSDVQATESQSHYDDLLFSLGTYPSGSMRDFYQEASYGQLDVIGLVSGSGGPTRVVSGAAAEVVLHQRKLRLR